MVEEEAAARAPPRWLPPPWLYAFRNPHCFLVRRVTLSVAGALHTTQKVELPLLDNVHLLQVQAGREDEALLLVLLLLLPGPW